MATNKEMVENAFSINFIQQQNRAHDLLKQWCMNSPESLTRLFKYLPKYQHASDLTQTVSLADAQFVIARELRLASWAKLTEHVQLMQHARSFIDHRSPLDQDLTTLHIRCGSDIQQTLTAVGLKGDFLEFSDPICQGPLVTGDTLIRQRAEFLSHYIKLSATSVDEIEQQLHIEQFKLENCAAGYERVTLWFEHDTYDQLILARILATFDSKQTPAVLEIVSLNEFPGTGRFIGLGQLPPEALRVLWSKRKPVTASHLSLGAQVWAALCCPTPLKLQKLLDDSNTEQLPFMRRAIKRHLQELPSVENGLGLCEQLILQILSDSSRTCAEIFSELTRELEPMPWLGDIMFWQILKNMSKTNKAIITISGSRFDQNWQNKQVSITVEGRELFINNRDWLDFSPNQRWVGGVTDFSDKSSWRWDDTLAKVVNF
ncbi:MAG: DUF1835 domain-containing protein [Oceanospirillaceae bacterium]|nr:DUF1835 domain-containing protein [Oceanospirillaceae bacterium]